ncbi:recombinase family protein [Paenibacillus urinalis]|uniref:Recombinase family protein n=1 Tax=Paenibacillus urinalis TaxID=521520 RepID=A0AAX3MV26_9BACL|nr:recombinase family protein [Paenibacillus urinalis]WDH81483.1 recombinase family protein [Paenibacillus urinalis]
MVTNNIIIDGKASHVKKRVATLYRVSTKRQLDCTDIPMQQRACRSFIDNQENWTLVKEYTERGVSGFKVSMNNRNVIQQLKFDAEKGIFDTLLVFMFDRIGRREDETPFVLEWLVEKGIQVWSVIEGEQKIEQPSDKFTNYLRFWQSSCESQKTSERVNERHIQMVEDGIFRGGGIPFGYSTVKSGKKNKQGKYLLQLKVNENEANVVKEIYRLAYEEGYGQLRIAKKLNENNVPTRKAKKWGAATVNVILKNPIYKGVMRYRKDSIEVFSDKIDDLAIINEEVWNTVQSIRQKKSPKNYSGNNNITISTKGTLLFIGIARCGCCNSRLTSTTFINKYKNASGEVIKYNHNKSYRCTGKLQGKTNCNGQSTFSANKVERFVLKQIQNYLDSFCITNFTKKVDELKSKYAKSELKILQELQNNIENEYEELSILVAEVPKSITGKSSFKPDLLNQLIKQKEKNILVLQEKITATESLLNFKKDELNDIILLKEYFPEWKQIFEDASSEKKKIMIGLLVDQVLVSKESICIELKPLIKQFITNQQNP